MSRQVITHAQSRLFRAGLPLVAGLFFGGIAWVLQWWEVLSAKPWGWRPNSMIPQWFITGQHELLPLILILAVMTGVAVAWLIRLIVADSRAVSRLGRWALVWPLLVCLTKSLALIGLSGMHVFPSAVTFVLIFPGLVSHLPFAPGLASVAAITSIVRKQHLGDLVVLPFTILWWLVLCWFELMLLVLQSD